jgi:hypothetical protein
MRRWLIGCKNSSVKYDLAAAYLPQKYNPLPFVDKKLRSALCGIYICHSLHLPTYLLTYNWTYQ